MAFNSDARGISHVSGHCGLQVYGDGLSTAYVGVPATLFLRLSDASGNVISNPAEYASSTITAQLLPVGSDADAGSPLPAALAFSAADGAMVGSYAPVVSGPHILELAINDSTLAGGVLVARFFCGLECQGNADWAVRSAQPRL